MNGPKSLWKLSCPVAESVVIVRPWKEFTSVTMLGRADAPNLSDAYLRAALMAHSLASAPELEKNTLRMPVREQSISAKTDCGRE